MSQTVTVQELGDLFGSKVGTEVWTMIRASWMPAHGMKWVKTRFKSERRGDEWQAVGFKLCLSSEDLAQLLPIKEDDARKMRFST